MAEAWRTKPVFPEGHPATEVPTPLRPPVEAELLDETCGCLGIGRSLTFPFPQWRARDAYRTVYFDEGEGRTLVFLHGLGGNATHFEHVVRPMADRYRVVGIDLVGCGWSMKPEVTYTVDLLCDHLLSFLDQRGIRRATLVGHSLGGAVCMAAALRRPAAVEGIALLCAAGMAPLPRWMRSCASIFLRRQLLYPFLALGADFILNNVFVDREQDNEYVRWFRASSLRDVPGYPNLKDFARVSESLCRDVVRRDFSDRFPTLRMPVLALWGDHDKLTSLSSVLRRLDALPRVRTVVLQRCGHLPMVERPKETVFHLERLLNDPP